MKLGKLFFLFSFFLLSTISVFSQIDESKTGAWYMYFIDHTFKDSSWGFQGDIQLRNWDAGSDLEQLLLRGGITYKPKETPLKITLGYGNITTGAFGEDKSTTSESRIYQELIFPVKLAKRIFTTHRFRYEQRFVENQDFRTRYRYNLFLNIPLNNAELIDKTFYLAFYNELFINGERTIGDNRLVEIFDRNRFYAALGYLIKKGMKVQLGIMQQSTDNWTKNQIQCSFHQTFVGK